MLARAIVAIVALALLALPTALAAQAAAPLDPALLALNGDWHFHEDRTPNRPLEQLGAPMSTFSFRAEADAVVLVRGHGSGHKDVRVAFDGSITEVAGKAETARYRGSWKDGVFEYQVDFVRAPGQQPDSLIRRAFRHTPDGLVVTAWNRPTVTEPSIAIFRHLDDIPMPTPAKAVIGDLTWLAGAWVGTRGDGGAIAIEERWGPPLGGSMLATSRTVAAGRLRAFEYLRVVERDGGLVYIAQPGGAAPTEFVLSEIAGKRAVFDNPRHDYPRRIVYELGDDGVLRATVGQIVGGTPRRFEFRTEAR
jgi:hypothetical protein